jgi:heme exporter protein A
MITTLTLTDLAVSRGDRPLFSGLNLTVEAGQAVALVGANGAGKTSLLRVIAGLIRPEAGAVAFADAGGTIPAEDARSRDLHMIGHQDGLKTGRTAWEELLFQVLWTGGSRTAAEAACRRLDLRRLLELEVRKLSAGQRRRLALARLIASPRALWLLDEPLAPLDAQRRAVAGELMGEHLAAGGLIVAAVHDPLPVPARLFEVGA